jgi:hypothetical protein
MILDEQPPPFSYFICCYLFPAKRAMMKKLKLPGRIKRCRIEQNLITQE